MAKTYNSTSEFLARRNQIRFHSEWSEKIDELEKQQYELHSQQREEAQYNNWTLANKLFWEAKAIQDKIEQIYEEVGGVGMKW